MTLHPRRWLVLLAPLAVCLIPVWALAAPAPSLLAYTPLDKASATQHGWVPRTFSLGAANLDFSTYVPRTADVQLAPLLGADGLEPGNIAALRVVGKVTLAPHEAPVQATMTVFHVATAPTAARICAWLLEEAGYRLSEAADSRDLATAQRIGHILDSQGRRERSALTACYVRGEHVLTLAFQLDSRQATSQAQRREWAQRAAEFASGMLSNLEFTDGKPAAHARQQLRPIPAVIGGEDLGLVVPDAWDVRINDFQGALPAELHLTRGADTDSRGALWLAAIPAQRAPSPQELTAMGKRLFPGYLMGQTPELRAYAPALQSVDPVLQEHGIASQQFRFPITTREGEKAGDLIGLLAWHDHTVYALSLWSRMGASTQRQEFFSRLPGLSAYDMLHAALIRHLAGS